MVAVYEMSNLAPLLRSRSHYSLSKIDGPDTSACTQIKDALGVVTNRCGMKLPLHDETVDVMNQIHSVLFFIVVGLAFVRLGIHGD